MNQSDYSRNHWSQWPGATPGVVSCVTPTADQARAAFGDDPIPREALVAAVAHQLARRDPLAAIEALLDTRVSACLKPSERHPGPCKGWRKTAHPFKLHNPKFKTFFGPDERVLTMDERKQLLDTFEGSFAGLKTSIRQVKWSEKNGRFAVIGDVINPNETGPGRFVGEFERQFYTEDGRWKVHHEFLTLEPHVQGGGFASRFNAHAYEHYREMGVSEVTLFADIDVGGYAWARAGYDFKTIDDSRLIEARIMDGMHLMAREIPDVGPTEPGEPDIRIMWELIPPERRDEQMAEAAMMLRRMQMSDFGDEDYPLPYEVAEMGRWRGAGQDDWWIGKVIMSRSFWNGVNVP